MHLDDTRVRTAAFDWLAAQIRIYGEMLPHSILLKGFELDGLRVPLISAQGIFKPKVLAEMPLLITTSPSSQYDDGTSPEGFILYKYRGRDPYHRDNVGLRKAMQNRVPLIYFYGVIRGKYIPVWPVSIIDDHPETLSFYIDLGEQGYLNNYLDLEARGFTIAESDETRRAYRTIEVRSRLHQRSFRERVLGAYREQCALCRLRYKELLDAAHIIPDGEPGGEPEISNGLSLCKLHHAAFDNFFLGIRPDYVIEIRSDVLDEEDGPMLLHGLKGLHQEHLIVPKSARLKPSPEKLQIRYQQFLAENSAA